MAVDSAVLEFLVPKEGIIPQGHKTVVSLDGKQTTT